MESALFFCFWTKKVVPTLMGEVGTCKGVFMKKDFVRL